MLKNTLSTNLMLSSPEVSTKTVNGTDTATDTATGLSNGDVKVDAAKVNGEATAACDEVKPMEVDVKQPPSKPDTVETNGKVDSSTDNNSTDSKEDKKPESTRENGGSKTDDKEAECTSTTSTTTTAAAGETKAKADGTDKDAEVSQSKIPAAEEASNTDVDLTPNKSKKKKKKLSTTEEDGIPKETRRSSRQRKPVNYADDVKIVTQPSDLIKCHSGADIEMIDPSDPLAISDTDFKKAHVRDRFTPNKASK